MQLDTESTICAIATGHEHGYRGAVRMSGWSCLQCLPQSLRMPNDLLIAKSPKRFRVDWELGPPFGVIPVDIWYWPTHRSYTGTPALELHTLGNIFLLKRIVEQLCRSGARLASPGEFTLRAFLAGRMDLTQCEAVLGVIEAKSETSLAVALRQLAGGLSEPLQAIRRSLIDLLADLEAGLDFVDEDIEFISREQVVERLSSACDRMQIIENQLNQRQRSEHPPRVVLLGLPNAGKSSLANALAEQNAAIVSDQAGTTRDFVRVRCNLPSGDIELVDTAGIDSLPSDLAQLREIDRLAQRHSNQQREEADLILYCIDSRLDPVQRAEQLQIALVSTEKANERSAMSRQSHRTPIADNVWVVWTKVEQGCLNGVPLRLPSPFENVPSYATSSVERECLRDLLSSLDQWIVNRDHELSSIAPMTETRCRESLRTAMDALHAAHEASVQNLGDEIVASEIRLSLEQLASVAGEVYTDDVLDSLFSRFCIGK